MKKLDITNAKSYASTLLKSGYNGSSWYFAYNAS